MAAARSGCDSIARRVTNACQSAGKLDTVSGYLVELWQIVQHNDKVFRELVLHSVDAASSIVAHTDDTAGSSASGDSAPFRYARHHKGHALEQLLYSLQARETALRRALRKYAPPYSRRGTPPMMRRDTQFGHLFARDLKSLTRNMELLTFEIESKQYQLAHRFRQQEKEQREQRQSETRTSSRHPCAQDKLAALAASLACLSTARDDLQCIQKQLMPSLQRRIVNIIRQEKRAAEGVVAIRPDGSGHSTLMLQQHSNVQRAVWAQQYQRDHERSPLPPIPLLVRPTTAGASIGGVTSGGSSVFPSENNEEAAEHKHVLSLVAPPALSVLDSASLISIRSISFARRQLGDLLKSRVIRSVPDPRLAPATAARPDAVPCGAFGLPLDPSVELNPILARGPPPPNAHEQRLIQIRQAAARAKTADATTFRAAGSIMSGPLPATASMVSRQSERDALLLSNLSLPFEQTLTRLAPGQISLPRLQRHNARLHEQDRWL